MSEAPIVSSASFECDELEPAMGPEFLAAMDRLAEAGQTEGVRAENILPGPGMVSRDKIPQLAGGFVRIAPYDPLRVLGAAGGVSSVTGSVPLSVYKATMASSRVTGGDPALRAYHDSLDRAMQANFPGVCMGYGANPYGDFVVYASYVYPESHTLPPVRPFLVDSEDGLSIGFTLVNDPAVDPVGIVFLYKQLRRCRACGFSASAYRPGEFLYCKQCVLNGGMCACYCNRRCQRADWAAHKPACETPRLNTRMQKELPLS